MDVNLSLVQMQLLKTVYGRFPTTDATLLLIQLQDFWKQFTGSPVTDVNLSLVQTLLNFWKQFTNSSQQRILIYRLFRLFSTSENSLRMPPDTDVNLLLIQTPNSDVVQNMDTFLILIPNGISKPIPASIALTSANFRAL